MTWPMLQENGYARRACKTVAALRQVQLPPFKNRVKIYIGLEQAQQLPPDNPDIEACYLGNIVRVTSKQIVAPCLALSVLLQTIRCDGSRCGLRNEDSNAFEGTNYYRLVTLTVAKKHTRAHCYGPERHCSTCLNLEFSGFSKYCSKLRKPLCTIIYALTWPRR